MVVNNFRVFVCNTVTGKITADLPGVPGSWGMKLNDAGSITASVPALADEYKDLRIRSNTRPLFQSLGIAYGDHILECGPIWERGYDGEGKLDLTASGIWSILDNRKAVQAAMLAQGVTGATVTASTLKIEGRTLGSIVRELVRLSIEDNPHGALNIVLPLEVAGDNYRTYDGYSLGWIGDRIREITAVQNGPDVRFRPRFKGEDPTVVEWVLETGTTEDPLLHQTGADWTWDGTVEQSGVVGFTSHENARGMGSLAWAPGAGQERAMKLALARDTALADQGMPWLEVDDSRDTEDLTILQSHADRLLDESQQPWLTVGVRVRADMHPVLGSYLPGDWANLVVPDNHPTLDPGPMRVRVMAVDGNVTNTVSLTLAPLQDTTPNNRGAGETTVNSDSPGYLPGTWSAASDSTWNALPEGSWEEA